MTFKMRMRGGLRRVLAKKPEPSWCKGEEGDGRIRCCISIGTGVAFQVSGNTGLISKPEPALTSALGVYVSDLGNVELPVASVLT